MNFETVKFGDGIHVVVKGVVSSASVRETTDGEWTILMPCITRTMSTLDSALSLIACALGNWYTVTEAAVRLAELGKTSKPPVPKTMYAWLQAGRFPGAVKVQKTGRGGAWRIPESALKGFERKGSRQ